MPLALKKAILLKAKLPQNFYLSSHSKLASLEKELGTVVDEIQDSLTDYYCDSQNLKHFSQVSFFFNWLCIIFPLKQRLSTGGFKMKLLQMIALALCIIGGVNWGLIGLFGFNLVSFLFGSGSLLENLIYIVVGLSAVLSLSIYMLFTE